MTTETLYQQVGFLLVSNIGWTTHMGLAWILSVLAQTCCCPVHSALPISTRPWQRADGSLEYMNGPSGFSHYRRCHLSLSWYVTLLHHLYDPSAWYPTYFILQNSIEMLWDCKARSKWLRLCYAGHERNGLEVTCITVKCPQWAKHTQCTEPIQSLCIFQAQKITLVWVVGRVRSMEELGGADSPP